MSGSLNSSAARFAYCRIMATKGQNAFVSRVKVVGSASVPIKLENEQDQITE